MAKGASSERGGAPSVAATARAGRDHAAYRTLGYAVMPAARRELASRRLAALRLAPLGSPSQRTPLAVVEHHLAMQAQDLSSGLWSIGVRTGGTVGEVLAAVERGEITRTWPMRGTLHWVATADAAWLTDLLVGPSLRAAARVLQRDGVSAEVIERAGRLWAERLDEAGAMTRADASATLAAGGLDPSGQRTYYLLVRQHQLGLLRQGPIRRTATGPTSFEPTFVRAGAGVASPPRMPERPEALAALADSYVRSHGPVTERDFAGWCDQPLRVIREAVAATDGRVGFETIGDTAYLVHADAPPPGADDGPVVLLLPGFDEWLLGYKDRSAQLTREQERAVVPGGNGMFRGTLVADGAVGGTWRRSVARGTITVAVTPVARPPRSLRSGAQEAVAAYGRFWDRPAALRWADG